MNTINRMIRGVLLFAVSLALSACGAIPTAADKVQAGPRDVATEATEGQIVANNSGLGTIVYNEKTRPKCKRVRSTGSNIGRSSCTPPDSGSQAVRTGVYSEPVPTVTPGMSRPNN